MWIPRRMWNGHGYGRGEMFDDTCWQALWEPGEGRGTAGKQRAVAWTHPNQRLRRFSWLLG
jgi:hypothetical protein